MRAAALSFAPIVDRQMHAGRWLRTGARQLRLSARLNVRTIDVRDPGTMVFALRSGGPRLIGRDVVPAEPLPSSHATRTLPNLKLPNVTLSTRRAFRAADTNKSLLDALRAGPSLAHPPTPPLTTAPGPIGDLT